MKTLYILLLTVLAALTGFAQPSVNICVENTGTKLEVKIQPDAAFTGFMANIQLTIVCDDPSVTYGLPSGNPLYTTLATAGATTALAGKAYQKFAGFGTAALSVFGTSWTAGEVITLFTIVPSDLSAGFTIGTDSWTEDNNGVYYIELNAIDKTGTISTCSSFTLPVEGLNFEATPTENYHADLYWETLSESNSDFFAIEKSIDGGLFEEIATLKAAGNSQEIRHYRYLDKSAMGLQNDYRLRQVDLDGSYNYSDVRTVLYEAQSSIGSLYPNPARDETHLSIFLAAPTQLQLQLFNGLGQVVFHQKKELYQGSQLLNIPTHQLAEGIYQLRVSGNGQQMTSQALEVTR